MTDKKLTLGQAIDQIVAALESLDDNSRLAALSAVCAHLNIAAPPAALAQTAITGKPDEPENAAFSRQSFHPRKHIDIRSLKDEKQPQSPKQMACVVAYYLQELSPEGERKDTVSPEDLAKYFKQAGFKLPSKPRNVLFDAKNSGYFESTTRGEYKLNAVGYNLVVHGLPVKTGT